MPRTVVAVAAAVIAGTLVLHGGVVFRLSTSILPFRSQLSLLFHHDRLQLAFVQ